MSNDAATVDPLQQAIARAKLAQTESAKRRKDAPDVKVNAKTQGLPVNKQLDILARRDGFTGNNTEMHYVTLDRDLVDTYPDQGYEPVLRPGGGQETWAGDPIFRIPMADYEEIIARPAAIDKARMTRKSQEEQEAEAAGMATTIRKTAKHGTAEGNALIAEVDA